MLIREGATLKVAGPMNIDSVSALLAQSEGMLEGATTIDLSGVTEADSSGVSLLLEWQRQAKKTPLRFAHLPPALQSLAELYGVVELIPQ